MILDTEGILEMFKKVERQFYIESFANALDRQFAKDFVYSGESHIPVELVYVYSGNIEVVEDEKVYLMQSGDIIFHAPMEFHKIRSDKDTSPRVYNLSAIIQGCVPENLYDGIFSLDIGEREEFSRIFSITRSFLNDEESEYTGQECADAFTSFIMRICRSANIKNRLSQDPRAIAFQKLVKTMNEEIYNNISLETLAKLNFMSVSYVKLLFRHYTDISPKKYYANLRANEAARLVLKDVAIMDIAKRMNFSSQNYFSTFFKTHFGMTPMEYKKNNK